MTNMAVEEKGRSAEARGGGGGGGGDQHSNAANSDLQIRCEEGQRTAKVLGALAGDAFADGNERGHREQQKGGSDRQRRCRQANMMVNVQSTHIDGTTDMERQCRQSPLWSKY